MGTLRDLPRVDVVLADARLADWPRELARAAVREVLDEVRASVRDGGALPDDVAGAVAERLTAWTAGAYRPVINATGVVLHTNLGRAPWAEAAIEAGMAAARGYGNVEVRLADGSRGGRLDGVRDKLCRLTGAEDAIAVNNNAAAVLLALTALARGRDVLVSRGELVEIGGSFRVPDVVASGGANLVAVGTTNRTRAADYDAAACEATAVILTVHPSNFRMEGFVQAPRTDELAAVAQAHGLTVVADLGSGALDTVGAEPGVRDALRDGADVVAVSADKLLGGPQAGLLVGRADVIRRLRAHPLYRALRLDKVVIAALDATLGMRLAGRPTPVEAMLAGVGLDARVDRVFAALHARGVPCERVDIEGRAGGGSRPEEGLPGPGIAVDVASPDRAIHALRTSDPAILCRIHQDRVIVDCRTVADREEEALVAGLAAVARRE